MKVIVVGGGWGGCAAALSACKQGEDVSLIERTDMLLGTGLVGGIMRNNGRFTAAEELIAMSGGEIFQVIDQNLLHRNINFPGHRHASLYNVATMEPVIRNFLCDRGINILSSVRITDVDMDGKKITSVIGKKGKEDVKLEGDVFIDATGTAGPPASCNKYGNGCAMCVLRCHSFGGRVSLTAKAGINEMLAKKGDQIGAFSGSCKLHKESLSLDIQDRLNRDGVAIIHLPASKRVKDKLSIKACQQYAISEFEENIVLLDTGHAKLMTPFFALDALRDVPGMENARYEDPYSGGLGNSIRFMAMAPRNDALKVEGTENLFCAGEKAGLLVGHTEAICTGTLAGYNAIKYLKKEDPLILPDSLAIGDAVKYVRDRMMNHNELDKKITFSGSIYFDRMKEKDLYTTDVSDIQKRVEEAGMARIFSEP
jgi:hypothetical protein